MRVLLLAAGAVLTLTACGGGETNTSANTSATDANMMGSDANMMGDPNMMMTDPSMNGMNGMSGNMAVDPATQNMIQQDMNTNSPDTNLANGM